MKSSKNDSSDRFIEQMRRSTSKCVVACEACAGIILLYYCAIVIAFISDKSTLNTFSLIVYVKSETSGFSSGFVFFILPLIIGMFFCAGGVFIIGFVYKKQLDFHKSDKERVRDKVINKNMYIMELIVYAIVSLTTILISASVGTFKGIFSAVPFVIFAFGAIATESVGNVLLTLLIHFIIYYTVSLRLWGATSHWLEFHFTMFVSYFCVLLPISCRWLFPSFVQNIISLCAKIASSGHGHQDLLIVSKSVNESIQKTAGSITLLEKSSTKNEEQ